MSYYPQRYRFDSPLRPPLSSPLRRVRGGQISFRNRYLRICCVSNAKLPFLRGTSGTAQLYYFAFPGTVAYSAVIWGGARSRLARLGEKRRKKRDAVVMGSQSGGKFVYAGKWRPVVLIGLSE